MKTHPFNVHVPVVPVNVWAKLRRLARLNSRTIKAEVMIAIVSHLQKEGELTNSEIGLLLSADPEKE